MHYKITIPTREFLLHLHVWIVRSKWEISLHRVPIWQVQAVIWKKSRVDLHAFHQYPVLA